MINYYFDPEEKEYIEVERRYPVLHGPNGEPPLSPIEIYKRKREEFFCQRERTAKGKAAKQALEKDAKAAMKKALAEAVKDLNK